MKKILGVLLVGLMLCATGCGKDDGKKLECGVDMMGIHQDVVVKFDKEGKNIKSLDMTMTYSEELLSSLGVTEDTRDSIIKENIEPMCDTYTAYKGIKCDVKDDGKKIDVVISVSDYAKLEEDAVTGLGFANDTYDNLKSDLEAMSYTCK